MISSSHIARSIFLFTPRSRDDKNGGGFRAFLIFKNAILFNSANVGFGFFFFLRIPCPCMVGLGQGMALEGHRRPL